MDDILRNTTLAILAGGEGSRMGKPKGLLELKGRPILQHILQTANWPGPTLLVTAPGRQSPPGAELFDAEASDPISGQGPMRGVLTALENATTEQVVVVPVDMPSLGSQPLYWLAEQLHNRPTALAILLQRQQRGDSCIEPLPAGFRRSASDLLRQRLDQAVASLQRLIEVDRIYALDVPRHWPAGLFENLNHPDDLARWESSSRGV